jgi:hypothetical protein
VNKTSTKYIMYQIVFPPCTKPMYINYQHHTMCQRYHQWNVSTMCICQYSNHVHLSIFQPCSSINMPTMCIYQHAKTSVISLMICLQHEPSATIMYLIYIIHMSYTKVLSSTNGVLLAKYYHQTYTIYECTKHVSPLVPRN